MLLYNSLYTYIVAVAVIFVCHCVRMLRRFKERINESVAIARNNSYIGLSLYLRRYFVHEDKEKFLAESSIPGPRGLPFFGYMLSLGPLPHESLAKLTNRYGNMFKIKAGCRRFIVLSSIENLELIARQFPEQLCGKPRTFTTDQLSIGAHNDILQRWKRRRAYMNAGLKYLERYSVKSIIEYETSEFLKYLKVHCEVDKAQPKVFHDDIAFFVARIIYRMSYGVVPDMDTLRALQKFVHALPDYTTTIGSFSPFDLIPSLRYLYPTKFNKFVEFNRYVSNLCRKEKLKAKSGSLWEVNDEHAPPASLFEHFRRRWERMSDSDKMKFNIAEDTLYDGLEDILRAGTESPSLIIQWFLLYVAVFPHVQAKMQRELDDYMAHKGKQLDVLGADDLPNLPYCQAAVMETFRYSCLNPFLKRELTGDLEFKGFLLRRGTVILFNQWAINNNPAWFPEPQVFQPERFLDSDCQFDETLTRKFMPFGFGKRRCIGVETGKMIVQLAAIAVVYKFNISTDSNAAYDFKPIAGISLTPKQYKLQLSFR